MPSGLHQRCLAHASALAAIAVAAAGCGSREAPVEAARQPGAGATALFSNGNFATGDFTSWTTGTNLNYGITYPPASISDLALRAGGTAKSYVRTGATESQVPAGLTSAASVRYPKFGNDVAVVNELGDNRNVNTLVQTYATTAADVDPADGKIHVRFALAPVLENPAHSDTQQPYFYVQLRNVTQGTVLFNTFNYSNQPGVPWKTDPGTQGTSVTYTDWRAFDIAPGGAALQIGDSVQVEVIAAGCSLGGHFGEVYVGGFGAFFPTLSVAASAPQQANAGTNLTYSFLVKNGSTLVVPNVVVDETLPASTTFVSLSAPGATCTTPAVGSAGTVSCNFGWMNPSASTTFTLTVRIDPAATGSISNGNYEIHGDSVSPFYGPLVQTALTTGVTYADLAITKTDGLAAVAWGQPITYSIVVTNNGPSAVTGAVVTDALPAQVAAASATWTCSGTAGGTCGAASGTGSLATSASLPVGGSVTYLVATNVIAGSGSGTVNNVATVSPPAGVTDPDPTNNSAADLDSIGPLYALALNKTPPAAGAGTVVSSPAAINCGPTCATATANFASGTSVTLTAIAAPGDTFLGWTSGPCSGSSANACTFTLSAATSATASFKGQDVVGSVAAGSGSIACTTPVATGTASTCSLAAGTGYVLDGLTDNGTDVTAAVVGGSTYTINSVTAAHAVVATFKKDRGVTCAAAAECHSSQCVDGVCCNSSCSGQCQACNLPGNAGTCAPVQGPPVGSRPACTSDGTLCGGTCDGVNPTSCLYPSLPTVCRVASCAGGTETLAATCDGTGLCPAPVTQACGAYACQATSCATVCLGDADCASGYFCSAGSCVPQGAPGAACTGANQCASGFCADGVCCNAACTGQCEACNLAGAVGTCKATTGAPQGGRPACTSDGSSCGGSCNGVLRPACTYPGSGTQCRSASCLAGTATLAATCAGTGSCPAPQTQACGAFACGATACNTSCSSDVQCASGYFCSAGSCVPQGAPGAACTGANQCASGSCADGVCCDSACTGQCEACNLAGSVGACSPVAGAPQGGRAACASDGSACGGLCDGSSRTSCAYPGAATQCRSASCLAGTATLAATCSGTGSCPAPQTQACGAFACGSTACLGNCAGDVDCAVGYWCSGGVCTGKGATAAPCGAADQCLSGFCVDGVCCDSSCGGTCEACDVPGAAGTCSAVVGAPHGGRPACASDGSACGGSCDGSSRAACSYPFDSTVCRPGSCAAGVATLEARCAGNGSCPPVQTQACGSFACGPSACLGTCSVDADCASGSWCSGGVCIEKGGPGVACGAASQCASGFCADGVCCDGACAGQCEACDVSGRAGTCTPVSGPPRGSRAPCASDATACGGTCDGTSTASCAYPGTSTACRTAACSAGSATLAASCNGTGACPPAQVQPCGAFACGANACLGSCSVDADCSSGNWCSGGVCVPLKANGGSCGGAAECQSGLCVDGACCDRACAGQCEACDVPGAVGTCTPVSGAPHGVRIPCASDGSACGGACDGASAACAYPGASTSCRAPECAAGVATLAASCDGAGACPPREQESCGRFACSGTACLGSCTSDSDCAAGSRCANGTCVAAGPSSGWHVEGSGCASAGANGLLPLLGALLALAVSRRRRGRSALLCLALLAPLAARAQASRSFTVERFAIAPGARDLLGVYSATTAAPLHFDLLVSVDYANQPLKVVSGSTQVALVSDQWNLQLGGSVGILPWLEVGLVLPATVAQSGQAVPELDPALATYAPSAGFGDPRVVVRARLLEVGDFALAAIAPVTIPVGSSQNYIGWDSVTVAPAVAAEGSVAGLRLLANAGVALRPSRTEGDLTVGSAFTYGAAAAYRFPLAGQRFDVLGTITGEVSLNGSGAVYPAELLFALRWLAPLGLSAALGGGPGLSNGYGTPAYRLLAVVGFAPLDGTDRR
ncbi:MAG TPA: hypothetical protein VMT17_17535 [Anaeromyxobacteraceae bacterium]|nr:hypothetical protein [Anaeromyxobacteraceae bacterium]